MLLVALQSEPAWVRERIGCLTASRAKDAFCFTKKGEGADRFNYKIEVVTERLTDRAVDHPVTKPMQRGLDNEPPAKDRYEAETGYLLDPAGFVRHSDIEFCGASPDSFIARDGLAEFKVPLATNFVKWKLDGKIPEDHLPQLRMQLACTRRAWVDFVAYCPEMPWERQLFIRRLTAEEANIPEVEEMARKFLQEVDDLFFTFTHGKAA